MFLVPSNIPEQVFSTHVNFDARHYFTNKKNALTLAILKKTDVVDRGVKISPSIK